MSILAYDRSYIKAAGHTSLAEEDKFRQQTPLVFIPLSLHSLLRYTLLFTLTLCIAAGG